MQGREGYIFYHFFKIFKYIEKLWQVTSKYLYSGYVSCYRVKCTHVCQSLSVQMHSGPQWCDICWPRWCKRTVGVWEINLCHLCFALLSVLAECEGSMATIEVFSFMWHSGLQWCLACPPSFGQHPFQQRSSQTPSVELGVLWPWAGANISHRWINRA